MSAILSLSKIDAKIPEQNLVDNPVFQIQQKGQDYVIIGSSGTYSMFDRWIVRGLYSKNTAFYLKKSLYNDVFNGLPNDNYLKNYLQIYKYSDIGVQTGFLLFQDIHELSEMTGKNLNFSCFIQADSAIEDNLSVDIELQFTPEGTTFTWTKGLFSGVVDSSIYYNGNKWLKIDVNFNMPKLSDITGLASINDYTAFILVIKGVINTPNKTSNKYNITGVQITKDYNKVFVPPAYEEDLFRCRKFYESTWPCFDAHSDSQYGKFYSNVFSTGVIHYSNIDFNVPKITQPSITLSYDKVNNISTSVISSVGYLTKKGFQLLYSDNVNIGRYGVHWVANSQNTYFGLP